MAAALTRNVASTDAHMLVASHQDLLDPAVGCLLLVGNVVGALLYLVRSLEAPTVWWV